VISQGLETRGSQSISQGVGLPISFVGTQGLEIGISTENFHALRGAQ